MWIGDFARWGRRRADGVLCCSSSRHLKERLAAYGRKEAHGALGVLRRPASKVRDSGGGRQSTPWRGQAVGQHGVIDWQVRSYKAGTRRA